LVFQKKVHLNLKLIVINTKLQGFQQNPFQLKRVFVFSCLSLRKNLNAMPVNQPKRSLQISIATIAWLAVILQLYLQIVNRTTAVSEALIRFFSYFTILTNIIVAVCFTALALQKGKAFNIFNNPGRLTAVTVYILIVGLVYNLVLR
jgi:hypothetical protein